jgi:hypothetical protein
MVLRDLAGIDADTTEALSHEAIRCGAAPSAGGRRRESSAVHGARARLLPFVHKAHLQGEARRWIARYTKAKELIVASSPACQGLLWSLNERKLPRSVALEIMNFEGGA